MVIAVTLQASLWRLKQNALLRFHKNCCLIRVVNRVEALKKAIAIAGSQAELARRIGGKVRQQHVHYWLRVGYIPAERVLDIERATVDELTGAPRVTRSSLRPDLYPPEEREAA